MLGRLLVGIPGTQELWAQKERREKVILFVIYQTGKEGPQNGFRIALVKEDVKVDDATEQLRASVADGATESVVVGA